MHNNRRLTSTQLITERFTRYAEEALLDCEHLPILEPWDWTATPANENRPPKAAGPLRVSVTLFPNQTAQRKQAKTLTLHELGDLIRSTSARSKASLPWLKLASFGDQRTDKNCLRHNDNVLAIHGIELDYDGKVIPFDQAVSVAKRAGLAALLYTSASHTEAAPKWRMLVPTSQPLPPSERTKLVARVNGLYGGAFSSESFTLSQAYYFGSVNNNPTHRVRVLRGDYIDHCSDLDHKAIGKHKAPPSEASSSVDKEASPHLVAGALALIPNDDTPNTHAYWERIGIEPNDRASRAYWVKVGHATKAAAGEEGWAAFDAWSRKYPGYDEAKTVKFWAGAHPTKSGAGTLFWLADEACPGWREDCEEQLMAELAAPLEPESKPARKLPWIIELGSLLWGPATVSGKEYRFGADQSKVIDPSKGAWFDFATHQGGHLRELMRKVATAKRGPANADDVVMVCANDVVMRPLDWIWEGHLLRGSQELLSGLPDLSKSTVQIGYVACATAGLTWPDGAPAVEPMNVIMLTAEDTLDQIVKPRLVAAGANLERVFILKCIKTDEHDRQFMLGEDLERMEHLVNKIGQVGLITVDPITAYMGSKMDSHKATEVRSQLGPLKDFSERLNIALSTITHPAKAAGPRALDHFIGSQAFIASCRVGHLCIAEMVENEDGERIPTGRVLFANVRNTAYRGLMPTLAYRKQEVTVETVGEGFGQRDITAPKVVWEGVVDTTAEQAIAAAAGKGGNQQPKVQAFLREMLEGEKLIRQKEIEEAAKRNGISGKQLRTAREKLGIQVSKEAGKMNGSWVWELPYTLENSDDYEKRKEK